MAEQPAPILIQGRPIMAPALDPEAEMRRPEGAFPPRSTGWSDRPIPSPQGGTSLRILVIDDNPATTWGTSTYYQQFPAYRPGVGIMVSFASAVQLSELTIQSPSRGTVVEIRSAPSADSSLQDTEKIAEVTLGNGRTPASLAGSQPVEHVLLWITELSGGDGAYSSEISEVEFRRAGV
jgi:hypothetical protein